MVNMSNQEIFHEKLEVCMECEESIKFDVVELARSIYKISGLNVKNIDGVRVEFPDGWGQVWASHTHPALILHFEAQSPKRLEEIRELVESVVRWIMGGIWKTQEN